ncbi:MAG TPA: isoprenylcysteine carboxylmethyltransferase family protein [Balneolaceae bacterium]|nr:isoprenylcysteine carboxylmethyltransferase family protein [Balneolaceae bacterium]
MNLELKVPPVAVGFVIVILMWLSKSLLPVFSFQSNYSLLFTLCLAVTGIMIAFAGVISFKRAQTSTNPLDPATASSLVTGGIYRYSRNPMYLGFDIVLAAFGFYLSNFLSIALTALFILYMSKYQIQPEERVLESKFGDVFKEYKKQTRRWI